MTFPSFESADYLSAGLSENQSVFLPAKISLFYVLVLLSAFLLAVLIFPCASAATLPIFIDHLLIL